MGYGYNTSAKVQIMAWHQTGAKPLSEPMLIYYFHLNQWWLSSLSEFHANKPRCTFCITGPLWGESISHQWICLTKGQWSGVLMFSLMWGCTNCWINNCIAGNFETPWHPFDLIVMSMTFLYFWKFYWSHLPFSKNCINLFELWL